jgi:hypothetical protein
MLSPNAHLKAYLLSRLPIKRNSESDTGITDSRLPRASAWPSSWMFREHMSQVIMARDEERFQRLF